MKNFSGNFIKITEFLRRAPLAALEQIAYFIFSLLQIKLSDSYTSWLLALSRFVELSVWCLLVQVQSSSILVALSSDVHKSFVLLFLFFYCNFLSRVLAILFCKIIIWTIFFLQASILISEPSFLLIINNGQRSSTNLLVVILKQFFSSATNNLPMKR